MTEQLKNGSYVNEYVSDAIEVGSGPDMGRVKDVDLAHDLAINTETIREIVEEYTPMDSEPDYSFDPIWRRKIDEERIIKKELATKAVAAAASGLIDSSIARALGETDSPTSKKYLDKLPNKLEEVAKDTIKSYEEVQILAKQEREERRNKVF